MTLSAILNDCLQVFRIPSSANAPQPALDRALIDINATIQQLEDAGEDFFTREEIQIPLTAETETYLLAKNIQTVLQPAKLSDGTILRELTSRGQLLQFGQIFQGQLTNTVASSKPSCFFVESLRDTTDTTGDSVLINVHLFPKPSASFVAGLAQLVLNVINQPGQFTAAQLTAGTATIEVPHKYVESIFLPIMRYNASRSFLFTDKDKEAGIEEDYERALKLLSKADPRRPKPAESNDSALEEAKAAK